MFCALKFKGNYFLYNLPGNHHEPNNTKERKMFTGEMSSILHSDCTRKESFWRSRDCHHHSKQYQNLQRIRNDGNEFE